VTVRPPGPPVTSFGKLPPLDFVLDPSRLPTNWLGYTSLRAVVIGPSEWQQLTDEQRAALRTWIAAGGDLLLVDGSLDTVFPGNAQEVSVDSGSVVPYLFGNVHMVASKTVIADGLSHVIATMPAAGDPNWTLPVTRAADWTDLPTRGFRLPIRGVGGVPARAYLVILTLFSLIIGPANYLFLRRRRRQALLVLTVPLISCAFILLLATYVVAGEGFGVHGRSASLTMLDQRRQQAATRGSVSLYAAGWTPGAGLRFPRDMAVLPRGRDNRANAEELGLDLAESQRFAGGLVRARVPSNFETIAVRPARERLTFVHEGGNLSVVNGLGGPIRTLVYRTADAAYALDAPLAAGQKTVLRPAARALEAELPASHPMFARFVTTTQKQPAGSYIALMDRSPFWQPGIEGIAERDNLHMVLGLVEGEP
jgi:hypothetical protein